MAKYRKKPVVIEAVQWRGDNLEEVIAFTGRHKSAEGWIRTPQKCTPTPATT